MRVGRLEWTHEADEETSEEPVPGGIGLELGRKRQSGTVKALGFHTSVEAGVGVADTEPGHQSSNSSLLG